MADGVLGPMSRAPVTYSRISDSQVRVFIGLVLVSVPLCLAASLLVHPAGEPTFHFDEGGAVTASSTLMLAMSAAFAFVVYLLRFDQGVAVRLTWLIFAAGLAFLALDEQVELHERIGGELEKLVSMARFGLPEVNDLIVIAYGLAALPVLVFALPELMRWPGVTRLLLVSLPFYVVHTALDSVDIEQNPWWFIAEETAKLICVTLIFIAMLKLVVAVLNAMPAAETRGGHQETRP